MVDIIRDLCKQRGTNIKQLEIAVGFGNGTIARWDKNSPSVDKVQRVADALGVPITVILGGEGVDTQNTDDMVKFALFGDHNVDDDVYDEVKRFAAFAKAQHEKGKK